jgi:dienelactone hydrolase/formylglycine-generating enzyme required for sulfatase activity
MRSWLAAIVLLAFTQPAQAATYYVSHSSGNDDWDGASASHGAGSGPWKTLKRASRVYVPGDTLLLERGSVWNECLRPLGEGTSTQPITIGVYGEGPKPVIDREDYNQDLMGIHLSDQGGFKIVGIEFSRCMTGIYAEYSDGSPTKQSIWIEDCYFHDSLMYQHYEDYPKRKIGLGICFFTYERDKRIVLKDITIKNCVFRRLASGVWTNNPDNFNKNASYVYNFANMNMVGCLFEEGFQWQQGIRGVDGGGMRNCTTLDIGRDFRSFNGVAGSMFFRCKDWVFEDSEWGYVSIGLGSGDGEAFDFEGNCDNMTMRRCLFHDTDGPGFLLCCYASDGHAHSGIVMENCVINGKSKRPIGLPRCAIVNTTDWNESTWKDCRFYLSKGEALMRVMDPEKDKKTTFLDCAIKKLEDACSTPKLIAKVRDADENQPIELDFGKPTTVNEFLIKENPSSSIIRYSLECWDDNNAEWVSCFNGRAIGAEFVAPIVSRTTTKARLRVIQTKSGKPNIVEFAAFNDTTKSFVHDKFGQLTVAPRASSIQLGAAAPVPVVKPAPATTSAIDGLEASVGYPETVTVGSPGNKADRAGYGAVAYEFRIGKFEVTNAEFCEFLNGVAKTDAHSLYDSRMAGEYGGIARSGKSADYTYSVKPGMGRKPVNYVTWETALRYANWLTNGRGNGDTEKGSYTFDGDGVNLPNHATLAEDRPLKWVLPNEHEWFKAAYYDPDKLGGGGYWAYPSKGGGVPRANINSNAPSDVGIYEASPSGTFDQGGNVWEFNETRNRGKVGLRGGSFYLKDNASYMHSSTRYDVLSAKWPNYGFRVVALGSGEPAPARKAAHSKPLPANPAVPAQKATSQRRTIPWDFSALALTPKIHATTERPARGMRGFFYEGAEYKGKPTWVYAYYAAPAGKPPKGGWPAVVCAHGGGGTAYPEWVKKWNSAGYAAIAMDLEGHLPGGNSHQVEGGFPAGVGHPNAGPSRIDWFGDRDLPDNQQWFYHAVADVIRANSLLRSFPAINSRKIGLTGISWGGTVVSAVAGVDPRFAFVIPVYGGGFIHQSDNPGLAQWFPPKNMTAEQFNDYRKKWDPSAHLPHAKMPMLFVTSVADPVFQIDIFGRSAQAAGGPSTLCMRPWMIHAHGNGWNDAVEIRDFANSIVKDGPPLPKLERPQTNPNTGMLHTEYTGNNITEAWIYFTTSKGPWKDRKWGFIQCTIHDKELVAQKALPQETTAYMVYVFRDVGGNRSNHAATELIER